MESSKIDLISKIDFTKGFQSFHIKWPLKDLQKPKRSQTFTTTISDGDGKLALEWELSILEKLNQSENWLFALKLLTADTMVPAIYRLSISSIGKEPYFSKEIFNICRAGGQKAVSVLLKPGEVAKFFNGGNLAFHCWLDIPIFVAGYNPKKRKIDAIDENESFGKRSGDAFTSDAAKSFQSVLNDDDALSDVTLAILQNEKMVRRFPCHRITLSNRSPVFQRIFVNKQWKENSTTGERTVELVDVDEKTMEIVLNFIYTSSLPDISIDYELVSKIVYAADKYNLSILKNWAASFLILKDHSAGPTTRVEHLMLADRHSLDQLKSVCISHLSVNYSEYFKRKNDFDGISDDLFSEITKALNKRQYETTEIVLPSA